MLGVAIQHAGQIATRHAELARGQQPLRVEPRQRSGLQSLTAQRQGEGYRVAHPYHGSIGTYLQTEALPDRAREAIGSALAGDRQNGDLLHPALRAQLADARRGSPSEEVATPARPLVDDQGRSRGIVGARAQRHQRADDRELDHELAVASHPPRPSGQLQRRCSDSRDLNLGVTLRELRVEEAEVLRGAEEGHAQHEGLQVLLHRLRKVDANRDRQPRAQIDGRFRQVQLDRDVVARRHGTDAQPNRLGAQLRGALAHPEGWEDDVTGAIRQIAELEAEAHLAALGQPAVDDADLAAHRRVDLQQLQMTLDLRHLDLGRGFLFEARGRHHETNRLTRVVGPAFCLDLHLLRQTRAGHQAQRRNQRRARAVRPLARRGAAAHQSFSTVS